MYLWVSVLVCNTLFLIVLSVDTMKWYIFIVTSWCFIISGARGARRAMLPLPTFYNFSTGIGFLPYKLILLSLCAPHRPKCFPMPLNLKTTGAAYRIAGFCHEDFNVASHGIRNIKIRYIFYLVTIYHVRFCNCLVLCLYFSISLRSKWGLFQTLKQHYLMHESVRNTVVLAIGIH